MNRINRSVDEVKFFACVLLFVFVSSVCVAQVSDAQGTEAKRTAQADLLRNDVLQFSGVVAEQSLRAISVPADGFLVPLKRHGEQKTGDAAFYGVIVRNIDPVERALLQDAQDGKWDGFDLLRATLIAEGIRDPKKINEYEEKLDAIVASVKERLQKENGTKPISERVLTQELFETLHRELLSKGYNIDSTCLSRVLETGEFNCVSATVLFNCIAEKAGLEVCALEMPGHALSRVTTATGSFNLETTAPNWFSLQTESARIAATTSKVAQPLPPTANSFSAPQTTPAPVASSDPTKKLREISPVQLVATVYYNRGVDLLGEKNYAEAAAANAKALLLDPVSETSWGNLMATINNWSIDFTNSAKRYDYAAILLDQGVALDSGYEKFRINQFVIYHQWMSALAQEGRNADVQAVFALADKRLPNHPELKVLMDAIEQSRNR